MKSGLTVVEIIASILTAVSTLVLYLNDLVFFALVMLFWWLVIIYVPITLYSLLDTLFIRKRARKVLLPLHAATVLFVSLAFTVNNCDAGQMVSYYDKNEAKFDELVSYVRHSLRDHCDVHVTFEGRELSMFHVYLEDGSVENHWDEDARVCAPALMQKVGLDEVEFENIRKKLKELGCVGVCSGSKFTTVNYKRVGIGMYSYRIFPEVLTEDMINKYKYDCTCVYYRDNVVFEYGSGALGSICFPCREEALEQISELRAKQ